MIRRVCSFAPVYSGDKHFLCEQHDSLNACGGGSISYGLSMFSPYHIPPPPHALSLGTVLLAKNVFVTQCGLAQRTASSYHE